MVPRPEGAGNRRVRPHGEGADRKAAVQRARPRRGVRAGALQAGQGAGDAGRGHVETTREFGDPFH